MENGSVSREYLVELLEALDDEQLSIIDFDRLSRSLVDLCEQLDSRDAIEQELLLLKDDYSRRISGMVKAMAVVDRKRDAMEQALDAIADLEGMTAADLIACYRRTSARFRDCFPASFGPRNGSTGQWREVAPFKQRGRPPDTRENGV